MSTGFTLPTTITKRIKTLNLGVVSNDVIYTCPANCIADVYLSDLSHGNIGGFFALLSINLVRSGGPVSNVITVAPSQNIVGAGNYPLVLGGGGTISPNANANANAVVGDDTANIVGANTDGNSKKFGSVLRLFPNDFLVANYNGISSTAVLVYSTVETFGS